MVRVYRRSEEDTESAIKYLEKILFLNDVYLLGIRNDNNVTLTYKDESRTRLQISKDGCIIEDENTPFYLLSEGTLDQQSEVGTNDVIEDIETNDVIEDIEKRLDLKGVYVIGVNTEGKIVIFHRGSITKAIYLKFFGYGPVVPDGSGSWINLCS